MGHRYSRRILSSLSEKVSDTLCDGKRYYGYTSHVRPAESFFSIVGNVVTKSRNNSIPITTKLLVVVKNEVTKLGLCDVDSGIEFGGTNIDDDPDICAKINEEIDDDFKVRVKITGDNDDNSYEIFMDKEYEDTY